MKKIFTKLLVIAISFCILYNCKTFIEKNSSKKIIFVEFEDFAPENNDDKLESSKLELSNLNNKNFSPKKSKETFYSINKDFFKDFKSTVNTPPPDYFS